MPDVQLRAALAAAAVLVIGSVPTTSATASYDPKAAVTFTQLAAAAYCDPPYLWGWNGTDHTAALPSFKIEAVLDDAVSNTQAYVGYLQADNAVVAAYRGTITSNFANWLEDLETWRTRTDFPSCEGCAVHKGFFKDYAGLAQAVQSSLRQSLAAHPGAKTWITGHSLGAALAALLAADWVGLGNNVDAVYTMGEPRVGNDAFANFIKAAYPSTPGTPSYFRLVHNKDIVPHLPVYAFGFHHTPTEVWYNEDCTEYVVCDGSGEDPTCSDSLKLPHSVTDHLEYLGIIMGSGTC
mmetsp:Transcript_27648/g.95621  ORF Transcript_27648/g.95621 Transcript_27648/m.95621 type:complete len:294 (-) Transcript_27648:397-1278(-)